MSQSTDLNTNVSTSVNRTTRVSPDELIDATVFIINSNERKFLNIGLDPMNNFEVTVQIISGSRHVVFSPDFLRLIFSAMTNILPAILDVPPTKPETNVFVSNETMKLCKIVCRGQNRLSFQSKAGRGRRVLLNPKDVIALQHLEWGTFENIALKSSFIRPIVMEQVGDIVNYLKKTFILVNSIEDMMLVVESIPINILSSNIPKIRACFTSQLKRFAVRHIAEKWFATQNNPPEVFK